MNAALFTFTAALRAVTAQVAPDWQRAGVSDNGIEIYVDESSVDSDGTRHACSFTISTPARRTTRSPPR